MQQFKTSMKQPDIQLRNMRLKNKAKILTNKIKFTPIEQNKKNKRATN